MYNNTQVAHTFDKFLLVNKNCVYDAISETNQEMKNVDMYLFILYSVFHTYCNIFHIYND